MATTPTKTIERTWKLLSPRVDDVTRVFFNCLFRLDPGMRDKLAESLDEEREAFARALNSIVEALVAGEDLAEIFDALDGDRSGVFEERHRTMIWPLIMWTLQQQLGDAWTDEVDEAWDQIASSVTRGVIGPPRASPAEGSGDPLVAK